MTRTILLGMAAIAVCITGCAGRDPKYIASSAPWDTSLSCEQIHYMVASNERDIADLEIENSNKTVSNVAWFVGGLFVWPAWLMMDVKGAQAKEIAGYRARNEMLTDRAIIACNQVASSR